ncbi:hypothetical protein [Nocardiopsis dassonvillei]|uniref:hypothetical protein n=1 Tax=Nocardiopsis dassonvillei TaxID=2014 RepID=UPI00363E94B5
MLTPTGKTTRAERLAQPLAPEVAEQVTADHCPRWMRGSDRLDEVADAMDAARLRVLAA